MTASTQRATERLAPNDAGVARAAELLRGGRLVAFPTETVYGLGADGTDPLAVAALYGAKGRPAFNPLIAHVADLDAATREGVLDRSALRLAEAFWPGPLTLVVPRHADGSVSDLARSGLETVGLRVPSHALARHVLRRVDRPVVAPSANLSGRVSPTSAQDVLDDLSGRIDAVLMGAPTEVGIESTIVACLGDRARLLRPGGIAREQLDTVLGLSLLIEDEAPDRPIAPGALLSHYAPRAKVRLAAGEIQPGEAILAFGPVSPDDADRAIALLNLSETGDLAEAAAHLFAYLRRLDATGASVIAVSPIPDHGLGEAINDRLRRAAADR
jgi:L-threonylcarbamoyladenylate synthase